MMFDRMRVYDAGRFHDVDLPIGITRPKASARRNASIGIAPSSVFSIANTRC